MSIVKKLYYLIVFFIPYPIIRLGGLKISEILMLFVIVIMLPTGTLTFRKNKFVDKFTIAFILVILFSAMLSLIDPFNQYVYGRAKSIYYSFELGWIFRIIRMLTAFFFAFIIENKVRKNPHLLFKLFDIYIFSNVLLDLFAIFMFFKQGYSITQFGNYRTSLAATEPSEAGFINCFAIILNIFFYLQNKSRKNVLSLIILMIGQLVIGSTASIVAMIVSLGGIMLLYQKVTDGRQKTNLLIIKTLLVLVVLFIALYLLSTYTHILDKIIYSSQYSEEEGGSVVERITTIETCWVIFKQRYLFGVGFGNFGWYVHRFVTSPLLLFTPGGDFQPNNLYAELLAELGIVGTSLYIWINYVVISKLLKVAKKTKKWYLPYLMLALEFYILIHNITLPTIYSFQYWMLLAMTQIIVYKSYKSYENINFK